MTRAQDRKRCRKYYKAHAEELKAKRRARYRAKVLGRKPEQQASEVAA